MTILLHDAAADMRNNEAQPPSAMISEFVYADDTLVLAGENRGKRRLLLNRDKVEVMPVRCEAAIRKPDGSTVAAKTSLVYLGSVITASGDMAAEIGRRLGAARAIL